MLHIAGGLVLILNVCVSDNRDEGDGIGRYVVDVVDCELDYILRSLVNGDEQIWGWTLRGKD